MIKRNREIEFIINRAREILALDPYNQTKRYNIRKPTDAKDGRYRIRFGDYRIRYDIDGEEVILKKIGHRRDVYEYKWVNKD